MSRSHYDDPRLYVRLTWDGPGSLIERLNAQYRRFFNRYNKNGIRVSPGGPERLRTVRQKSDGKNREYSWFLRRFVTAAFRQDIPGSDWAYGGSLEYNYNLPRYRLGEIDRQHEGPVFDSVFVEHKDVMGLTVRVTASNLLGARSYRERTVFAGRRNIAPVSFYEERDRRIGPIFGLNVRGSF